MGERTIPSRVDLIPAGLVDRYARLVSPLNPSRAVARARRPSWQTTATGRLSGPELTCPDGHAYRAGDRVVTLAPGADGSLVTSQRAVVAAVDLSQDTLTLRTDDGQHVLVRKEEAPADRLGYGYATTVHRCQGSTSGRAHLLADGGGRELAYVAMSRARESTHVWTMADDLPQAVDDLRRDWSTPRTPTWAIDIALPHPTTLTREHFEALKSNQQARVAALVHAEMALGGQAILGISLPDRAATLGQAEAALAQARQARADLDTGRGVWLTTEAGKAIEDLVEARRGRQKAEHAADHGARWRDRHTARKEAGIWAQPEVKAEQWWEAQVAPVISRLDQEIALEEASVDAAANRFERRLATSRAVIDNGLDQQRHARNLAERLSAERNHLDGLPSVAERRRAATQRQQLKGFEFAPQHQPLAARSPGIEM